MAAVLTASAARFLIPMAVSLAFAILLATFITLILVPVNYLIVEQIKTLFLSNESNAQVKVI